jgi:uncharacterized membrane protein
MVRAEGSIHIERNPTDVFAFVADAANNPRWRSYVVATTWLDDGPMRVGRVGRQTSRLLGRSYTVDAEVVAWDPPRHAAWATVAGGATVQTDCRVDPDGTGSLLTIGAEGEFNGGILRLLSPLAIGVMKRQAAGDLRKLKAALEANTEASL